MTSTSSNVIKMQTKTLFIIQFVFLLGIGIHQCQAASSVEEQERLLDSSSNNTAVTSPTFDSTTFIFLIVSFILIQASILYAFGQPPIAKSGVIKLWHGEVLSSENSQHITDWYTFSHVIHGVIFYSTLSILVPTWSIQTKFLISLAIEILWEMIENSPTVINRYRQSALAQGYNGDSILNSVSDSLAMSAGFLLTHNIPAMVTLGLCVAAELYVGYMIRDNLTLNVMQLVRPSEAISKWQASIHSDKKSTTAMKEEDKVD